MFVKRLILPILVLGFGNLLWSQNATQVPVVEPPFGADKQGSPQEEEAHEKMSISNTLWIEEMTWLEIRDTIKKGTNRIIVGTGGLEQNGPFLANGKHNYQLQAMLPEIAKRIGNCLIAPIVKFVPEGEMYPKATGHMGYPGSVSLREETFKMLLKDICMSYQFSGFDTMILVGDSGGNQKGMKEVSEELNRKWQKSGTEGNIYHVEEYYSEEIWAHDFLRQKGITQIDMSDRVPNYKSNHTRNGMHDDIFYEAVIATIDPKLIKHEARVLSGQFALHGVDLNPIEKFVSLGEKLIAHRAKITASAFLEKLDHK